MPATRTAPTNIHPATLGRPDTTATQYAAPTSKGGTTNRATTSKGARSQHARHMLHDNSSTGRVSHAHPPGTTSQPPSTTPLCPPISPPLRRHTSPEHAIPNRSSRQTRRASRAQHAIARFPHSTSHADYPPSILAPDTYGKWSTHSTGRAGQIHGQAAQLPPTPATPGIPRQLDHIVRK